MKTFVVIPAHNEEKRIDGVLEGVKKYISKDSIVVVDDGSEDNTFDIARKSGVVALRHEVNLGKGAALKTGCEAALLLGADAVITMDADGQHSPDDLPKFIKKIQSGNDIVFGVRLLENGVPLVRALGNKIINLVTFLLFNFRVGDVWCGYRALTRKAYSVSKWSSSSYSVDVEMAVKACQKGLKLDRVFIDAIYYDQYKGANVIDAVWLILNLLFWRLMFITTASRRMLRNELRSEPQSRFNRGSKAGVIPRGGST
jgi:glycosyltransferase involved in cell wall biosynthesis